MLHVLCKHVSQVYVHWFNFYVQVESTMHTNALALFTLLASSARAITCPSGGTDTIGASKLQAYHSATGVVTPLYFKQYGAAAPTSFSIITVSMPPFHPFSNPSNKR
jgi:hypothetical protein